MALIVSPVPATCLRAAELVKAANPPLPGPLCSYQPSDRLRQDDSERSALKENEPPGSGSGKGIPGGSPRGPLEAEDSCSQGRFASRQSVNNGGLRRRPAEKTLDWSDTRHKPQANANSLGRRRVASARCGVKGDVWDLIKPSNKSSRPHSPRTRCGFVRKPLCFRTVHFASKSCAEPNSLRLLREPPSG